jgi:hypothetical protein
MTKGLTALIFLVLTVIIIFLVFQINDNSNRCREVRTSQQERVTKAARLIVQATTQEHPLFSYDHALEAKILLDEVIANNGGVLMSEKNLKLEKGRLESLRKQIYQQYQDNQNVMMDKIIERRPELDVDINEDAGLRKKRKRHHKGHGHSHGSGSSKRKP